MSWSFTINNLEPDTEVPETVLADMSRAHSDYPLYMKAALYTAKRVGMKSCTCSGFVAENPYNDDVVVDVSIRGLLVGRDFNRGIVDSILYGPDAEALEEQRKASHESP